MVMTRSMNGAERPEEQQRTEEEQAGRHFNEPPASPSMPSGHDRPGTSARPVAESSATCARKRVPSPPHSQRTTNSTLRLRLAELEAAEKLAEIKRKELALETELVKKRLAAQIATIEDDASIHGDVMPSTEENRHTINQWLQNASTIRGERDEELPRRVEQDQTRREHAPKSDIAQLTETLERMTRPQRRCSSDLPTFTGAASEWLPFKAAFRDSTNLYNIPPAENILRLRSCLKGEARDAVAALLHTATEPDVIMRTLEQSFGRPELIIDRVLDELKRLPRPGATATDLNAFAVKLQNTVCILQNIDRRGYLHNPMLAREVLEKLSPHVKSRWCDYADGHRQSEEPEIVLLSRFLMREADIALRYTYVTSTTNARENKSNVAPNRKRSAVYNTETTEERENCPSCSGVHPLHRCPNYLAMNISQRWEFVRTKSLCFRCVDKKHRRVHCKAKLCGVNQCRRPHHSSLHEEPSTQSPQEPKGQPPSQDAAIFTVAPNYATEPTNVMLKVCPIVVSGPRGEVNTYALLDEGATITLIDHALAKNIGASGPVQTLNMNGVGMHRREARSQVVTIRLRGRREAATFEIKARTVKKLQLREQTIPTSLLRYEHLQDLHEEELCYERARPLLLVGADQWELIVTRELRTGRSSEPAASRTRLGWVVHGTAPSRMILQQGPESVFHVYAPERRISESETHDRHLHELVENHFRIDALGVALKPRVSAANERAINIFEKTLRKTERGYEVGLPWKQDDVIMPPSYAAAANRLKGIEKKMDADPDFAAEYSAQIENLLAKGYAAPTDGTEVQSPVSWFLPHFAVENPNKPGKRRLVFDAAHKSHGVSLNDMLLEGPDLLLSLQGVLFRFREKPIAVTADIQEMFLRVKIRAEDQAAQQFLWRGADRTSPPRIYKMTSMLFGAASSPFIAHSVRDHNARAHADTHPRALQEITRSHYMDDLVSSYDDEDETRRTIRELNEVHAAASFTLRSWNSNYESVLRDIPPELRANDHTTLGGPTSKILGLFWDPTTDQLGFNTTMHRVPADVRARIRAPTKREALSAVMSIFDPYGIISNFTIRAKIILQSLWRLQISWDEPIPDQEAMDFAKWLEELQNVAHLRLPRCYALRSHEHVELHVFCDASSTAYAAVAYLRATPTATKTATTAAKRYEDSVLTLVAAKAKVAPRRTQSIPRLELQAALIGARLADTIRREHRLTITKTTYWSDSATVIHWIQNDARRYTPFVAHRLGEIAELTHRDEWRWLPTDLNVADDATRLYHTPITSDDRWFTGPEFLREPEETWPTFTEPNEDAEVLHTNESDEPDDHRWIPEPTRFSKYEKLIRATAYVLAFIDKCRKQATSMDLEHIERAERAILQLAQEESFPTEIKNLKHARPIPKSSRLYRLDPVYEDGVLRVRGRIDASGAPEETKHPVILDGRHHISQLIVLREHCAAGHANRERVTNDLRQRYWILHLRPTVRAIEHRCALCRVRKARPTPPATGDLPRARLDPFFRPFSNCGLDYFGPMIVKVGRRREKRWGALFTCLSTRGVHLEVVDSLSTDSAIMALRRMAARRGWPRRMYSDNATAFKGADRELRVAYAEWSPALKDEGLTHRMKWYFIPPGAPNQGGAWERLVRSVKAALAATLNEKAPTAEVLSTLLAEAEYSVNSRPLTHVSVSAQDPEALTPNHFLLGTSTGMPSTGPCSDADRRTWRASQALADSWWRRWLREYLPCLVPRGEPTNNTNNLKTGDVVIVVDRTLPRNVWPIGVVKRTYPGADGGVRVVDVRTKTGIFRRPASKLAVLTNQEEAQRPSPGGGC